MAAVPQLTPAEADAAFAAAQVVVETHRRIAAWLRPGVTLGGIDAFVGRTLQDLHARSCFLGYKVAGHPPFPSHACLSVNECVVHGTAGYYRAPLKAGDLLKIDIGVFYKGWVGDAAWTYCFGEPSPEVKRLTECGKEALRRGVEQLSPGKRYIDWATTVQDCVEKDFGFHCIENWGGHGYGRSLHEPPHLLNHRPLQAGGWPEQGRTWQPGNLVAVEPMIAIGTGKTVQNPLPGGRRLTDWPVFAADGSMSVHYEHDVLIGEHGPKILTEGLEQTPDVIPV